jgi:amidohydrolase
MKTIKMIQEKKVILNQVEKEFSVIQKVNDVIHDNPELGNEEFKACAILTKTLEDYGYRVTPGVAGLKTAFVAEMKGREDGPVVAIAAEYDALPDLGHGCGHNVIASSAIGAAIGIAPLMKKLRGTVKIIGTPAEDSTAEKVRMIKAGVFKDVQYAMQCHPNDRTMTGARFKALCKTDFEFYGVASHAARAPEKGISSLDAVLLTHTAIEFLKEHVKKDVSIAGIITHGGTAAGSIPKFAATHFIMRSNDKTYLDEVIKRVYNCAKGAALATGTRLKIKEGIRLDSMLCVPSFDELFMQNAQLLDPPQVHEQTSMASSDFCSLSTIMPASRLEIAFVPLETSTHSQAFTDAGKTEAAYRAIKIASFAMAATAYDIFADPNLAAAITKDHGILSAHS